MKSALLQPKFALGRIIATPAALDAIQGSGQTTEFFLDRHVTGDWSSPCCDDRQPNDAASTRLLSAHKTLNGFWIWIITEADRSSTAIMLPSEY